MNLVNKALTLLINVAVVTFISSNFLNGVQNEREFVVSLMLLIISFINIYFWISKTNPVKKIQIIFIGNLLEGLLASLFVFILVTTRYGISYSEIKLLLVSILFISFINILTYFVRIKKEVNNRFKKVLIISLILTTGICLGTFSVIKSRQPEPYERANCGDEIYNCYSDVFVGKVVNFLGDIDVRGNQAAQYEVEIERNMKGDTNGIVKIFIYRGGTDGEWPTLTVGKSYQFRAKYDPKRKWFEASVASSDPDRITF